MFQRQYPESFPGLKFSTSNFIVPVSLHCNNINQAPLALTVIQSYFRQCEMLFQWTIYVFNKACLGNESVLLKSTENQKLKINA